MKSQAAPGCATTTRDYELNCHCSSAKYVFGRTLLAKMQLQRSSNGMVKFLVRFLKYNQWKKLLLFCNKAAILSDTSKLFLTLQ